MKKFVVLVHEDCLLLSCCLTLIKKFEDNVQESLIKLYCLNISSQLCVASQP